MLNTIISSTVLILGILLVRFLFRDKINLKLQYCLWGIVAFRLILFDLPLTNFFKSPVSTEHMIRFVKSSTLAKNLFSQEVMVANNPNITTGTEVSNIIEIAKTSLPFNWYEFVIGIWMIGIVLFLLWFLSVHFSFTKKVFQTRELVDFAIKGLDLGKLSVYQSDNLSSPCLMRYRGETSIYVTKEIANDDVKLYYAVIHEFCHKKHHDILWGYLRILLLSIYWFHPFVWISAVVSKQDCETACDYEVIQIIGEEKRISYGKALVSLAQLQQQRKPYHISMTTMMCETQKGIKSRIKQIIKTPRMLPITLITILVIVLIFITITFTGEAQTKQSQIKESQIKESQIKEAQINEAQIKESTIEETQIEKTQIEETPIEEAQIEESKIEESQIEESSISIEKRAELEEFAQVWATAYTNRDADKIYELCAEKEIYDTFGYTEVGYRWLGYSSPWPNQALGSAYLAVIEGDETIQVYYSHASSAPHTFVEKETLVVEKINGIYQTISRESIYYETVDSHKDFEEAYEYRYPIFSEDTPYYQLRADENPEKKEIFCNPIKMAENVLNISGATPKLLSQKEGEAQIQFKWEDGSTIVNMIQPDILGTDGIWIAIFEPDAKNIK